MSMFEYKKLSQLIGKGDISVQAMQVMTELQLFGYSGLLDSKGMREPLLKVLFKDKGVREMMFGDYSAMCYFLKMCAENSIMYSFLKYALDMSDVPDTIITVRGVAESSFNITFFDKMKDKAGERFDALVADKFDWFPYVDFLPLKQSGGTIFSNSSSIIPAPARGYLCNIRFFECDDNHDMTNPIDATDEFKALDMTVTVVLDFGDGDLVELEVGSDSVFFEGDKLSSHSFRSLNQNVTISIKDPVQATTLYTDYNMFVGVTYREVSSGVFS